MSMNGRTKNRLWLAAAPVLAWALAGGAGCIRVKTEPIHITMDVNLRVQRDLDSFFGDLDKPAATPAATPEAATANKETPK